MVINGRNDHVKLIFSHSAKTWRVRGNEDNGFEKYVRTCHMCDETNRMFSHV